MCVHFRTLLGVSTPNKLSPIPACLFARDAAAATSIFVVVHTYDSRERVNTYIRCARSSSTRHLPPVSSPRFYFRSPLDYCAPRFGFADERELAELYVLDICVCVCVACGMYRSEEGEKSPGSVYII